MVTWKAGGLMVEEQSHSLGYLLFYIADPSHKTRYPKQGVGYEPLCRDTTSCNSFRKVARAPKSLCESEVARTALVSTARSFAVEEWT